MTEPLIPPPLQPGDTVGIVAPAGPVDAARLTDGVNFLREQGFEVRTGRHTVERTGYLAGSDAGRLEDLHTMLSDPEVRGVLCARGGYGVMRLLGNLDTTSVERDPKLILGMSDITALQMSLYVRCGLVTFAGPLIAGQVARGLDKTSREALLKALSAPVNSYDPIFEYGRSARVLRSGWARGPLLGGCLSLVTALVGTGHLPDFRGAILFLEDVNEPLYRLDRMLVHLSLAGVLDRVSGVILGHFLGPKEANLSDEVGNLVLSMTGHNKVPMVGGFPHGHALPNVTLAHGLPVVLDTQRMVEGTRL